MTGQGGPGIIAASTRLHHVGVIQPDMAAAEAYMDVFGHDEDYRGYVAPFRCWCIFLKTAEPGAAAVELVIPDGGPLAKFNKGAGGLHHYAFVTPDIRGLQQAFAARDMAMLEPEPVRGAGDFLCNFLHPIATRGVIVEYVQPL